MLVSQQIELSKYGKESYMLHNGSNRYFVINEDSYALISILKEAKDFEEAFLLYNVSNADIDSASEFEEHVREIFNGKQILLDGDEVVHKQKKHVRLRLTLIPERLAGSLSRLISPLYHRELFPVVFLLAIVSSGYIFFHYGYIDLAYALTPSQFWYMIGFFMFSVVAHELGHISACKRYGGRHGGVGFGMYLIFPVFWADIHGIWMLPKKERLYINMAGIYIQLIIGLFLAAIYLVTKNLMFLESCFVICSAALFQLWPFVYLDGYWLMSDWLDTPNLNKTSTATIKKIFTYYLSESDKDQAMGFSKKDLMLLIYACFNYALLLLFALYLVVIVYRFIF